MANDGCCRCKNYQEASISQKLLKHILDLQELSVERKKFILRFFHKVVDLSRKLDQNYILTKLI